MRCYLGSEDQDEIRFLGRTNKDCWPGCVKGAGKHCSRIQGEGQCRIDKKGREPKSVIVTFGRGADQRNARGMSNGPCVSGEDEV